MTCASVTLKQTLMCVFNCQKIIPLGFGGNVGEGVREFFCSFTFKLEGEFGGVTNTVFASGLTGLTGATRSCFLSAVSIPVMM